MAYIDNPLLDENGNPTNSGTTPNQGGGATATGSQAQNASNLFSSAGAGPGASSGTGPVSSGAPQTSAGGQVPVFTNIAQYQAQNAPATQNLANNVATNLGNTVTGAQDILKNSSTLFNNDVASGTVNSNPDLINQAVTNPTSVTGSPTATEALTALLNANYTGPSDFNSDTNAYTPASAAVSNATSSANQVNSTGGREALIQSAVNGNNPALSAKQPASTGNLSLNNALVQNTPGALSTIKQAAAPAATLGTNLFNMETQSQPAVANAKTTTAKTASDTLGALQGAQTGIQNAVTKQVSDLQTQATQNQQVLSALLQSGAQLTPAALQAIGLTQSQYQSLLDQEKALAATGSGANNLAALGANALAGGQYTSSNGGAKAANTSTLTNLLGTGSSVVGGLSLANTINNLAAGGASAAEQAAAQAYLAMTPAQQVAADVAGEGAANIAANSVANIGSTAASDISSAVSDAASTFSTALPLIGGALSLGNIISTGTIGNGQGGLSGGVAGAGQLGSIGAAIGSVVPGVGTLIGGAIGAIAGFLSGLFGGASRGDLYAQTSINIGKDGTLSVGGSSQDNAAKDTTSAVATSAVNAINALCKANGLKVVDNGTILTDQGGTGNLPLGIYNTTYAKAGGMAADAAGLWYTLIQNNMIQPIPGSAAASSINNQPLDLSGFLTATNPTVNITAANAATQQQYQNYGALNTLLAGAPAGAATPGTFLQQSNIGQAGTATPYANTFNYNNALTQLTADVANAKATDITTNSAALQQLKKGLIGG